MADRYVVTATPGQRGFGILDRDLYDWCALPTENGSPLPLEWPLREGAQAWLNMCYRRWRAWESERQRKADVPLRWRPHPQGQSPWDQGWRFYNT